MEETYLGGRPWQKTDIKHAKLDFDKVDCYSFSSSKINKEKRLFLKNP